MLFIRSVLLTGLFFLNWIAFALASLPLLLVPRAWVLPVFKAWGTSSAWLLRAIVGAHVEVRGAQNIPQGAALIASKHQSAFETFALAPLMPDASLVLKQELNRIPLFGWWTRKLGMVSIDRSRGVRALKQVAESAQAAFDEGRQLIIFPEGTRRAPGAPPDYKAGAAHIYTSCDVPCVPVALNSGLFWPRRSFVKYPGTIVVEFLEPIEPGLDRRAFMARLEQVVEAASDRLLVEGAANQPPPPLGEAALTRLAELAPAEG